MCSLSIKIYLLPTDPSLVSLTKHLIGIVEVAPTKLTAVRIIYRSNPFSKTRSPKYFWPIELLEHAPVLRHGWRDVIVETHHDEIALPPAVAIHKAFWTLEVLDYGKCDKMLQSRKLRPVHSAVQKHAMKGIMEFSLSCSQLQGEWIE